MPLLMPVNPAPIARKLNLQRMAATLIVKRKLGGRWFHRHQATRDALRSEASENRAKSGSPVYPLPFYLQPITCRLLPAACLRAALRAGRVVVPPPLPALRPPLRSPSASGLL